MHPVVLSTDSDAATHVEAAASSRPEEFHVSGGVFIFVNVMQAVGTIHRLVLILVNPNGVAKQRLRVSHDGNVGNIRLRFAAKVGSSNNGSRRFAGFKAPRPQHGGGGDVDRG